jgi:hypothetical protein
MSNSTTTLDLNSIDRAMDADAQQHGSELLPQLPRQHPLHKVGELLVIITAAPLVLVALLTVLFALSAKLVLALLTTDAGN